MIRKLKPILDFLREVWQEFSRDRGALFAAAISFFGVISIIPLILLAIGIFGYFIGSQDALQEVLAFVRDYVPVGNEILEKYLRDLSRDANLLSGIGLLGLLWAGTQVFVILQQVMNVALCSTKHVGFLRARGVALILVVVAGALFVLSIGITSMLATARALKMHFWGINVGNIDVVWHYVGIFVPVFISILAFTFIYKFTPTKNIGNKGPVVGGLTAGLLFETAKHAFRWYVTHVANYNRIYGSLGGVIVLVVWIYYVSLITVIGAEVASVYARREGGRID